MEKKKVKDEEPIVMSNVATKSKKEQTRELLKKFADEEKVLVKGRFKCIENPGDTVRFNNIRKYPEDLAPVFTLTMTDGGIYQIPLWMARYLNGIDVTAKALNGRINSCSYPIHGYLWDEKKGVPISGNDINNESHGVPVTTIAIEKIKQRYAFESLEFSA